MHPAHPDDPALPDTDALLAGTLSLMTAWSRPCPPQRMAVDDWQRLIARKVVSNLFFLMHHPGVSPALATVLARLHGQWRTEPGPEAACCDTPTASPTAVSAAGAEVSAPALTSAPRTLH